MEIRNSDARAVAGSRPGRRAVHDSVLAGCLSRSESFACTLEVQLDAQREPLDQEVGGLRSPALAHHFSSELASGHDTTLEQTLAKCGEPRPVSF